MILATIITYNPEIDRLKKNIDLIIDQVDKVLLVDNDSQNIQQILLTFKNSKIEIIRNEKNIGIAAALNKGLNYASGKFKYILTLDQDSMSTPNMVNELKNGFFNDKIAIVSPSIFDLNTNEISSKKCEKNFEDVEVSITSGSLCDVDIFQKIKGFEEKLFIDLVDFEACLRLKKKDYRILISKNAVLNHEVGKSEIKKLFGMKFIITNHSPLRYYYMFRNGLYVNNKYNKKFSKKWIKQNLKLIKKLLGILIYETNKLSKLTNIIKGIKDSKLLVE